MLRYKLVPFHFHELNFLSACVGLLFCMLLIRAFVVHKKESSWKFGSLAIISHVMLDRVVLNRLPTHLLPTRGFRIEWPPLGHCYCLSAWVSGGWSGCLTSLQSWNGRSRRCRADSAVHVVVVELILFFR